jgi:pimeloyl-ACP methyl ester carboxylesterase
MQTTGSTQTFAVPGAGALVPEADVEPTYFGSDGKPLFGCYHAPQPPVRAGRALVICQPFGQEYVRCHRLLRLLAASLAQSGLPVLRFDYFGCGDSKGDAESATLARAIADLGEAVRFVRGRARALSVDVLGLRLGAAIACRFASERRGQVERLVLWDPIVHGSEFLTSMQEQQVRFTKWLARQFGRALPAAQADGPNDFIGFRFCDALLEELGALDLMQIAAAPCREALVLAGVGDAQASALHRRLVEIGVRADIALRAGPKVWLAEPYQGLVPRERLDAASRWLLEVRE